MDDIIYIEGIPGEKDAEALVEMFRGVEVGWREDIEERAGVRTFHGVTVCARATLSTRFRTHVRLMKEGRICTPEGTILDRIGIIEESTGLWPDDDFPGARYYNPEEGANIHQDVGEMVAAWRWLGRWRQ